MLLKTTGAAWTVGVIMGRMLRGAVTQLVLVLSLLALAQRGEAFVRAGAGGHALKIEVGGNLVGVAFY